MGIWPDASNFEDVNSVCASSRGSPWFDPDGARTSVQGTPDASNVDLALKVIQANEFDSGDGVPGGGYLVTADDFSIVKLFNYPVVWDDAPYKAFRGHASHILCIRFNCNDRLVFSAGGHDRGIYQWRTSGISLTDDKGVKRDNSVQPYNDRLILKARDKLLVDRRDNNIADQPTPGVEWGEVEGTAGKVFGPRVIDEAKRREQEEARAEELKASGSMLSSQKEQAALTPGKQTLLGRR